VSYSNFLFIFFFEKFAFCILCKCEMAIAIATPTFQLRFRDYVNLETTEFSVIHKNLYIYIYIYIYSKVIITNTFSIARFCITQIAFKPNRLEAFRRRESRLSIALVPSFVLFIMQQFRTIERLARAGMLLRLSYLNLNYYSRNVGTHLTCESHEISYRKKMHNIYSSSKKCLKCYYVEMFKMLLRDFA
jgi:hypothetical protein